MGKTSQNKVEKGNQNSEKESYGVNEAVVAISNIFMDAECNIDLNIVQSICKAITGHYMTFAIIPQKGTAIKTFEVPLKDKKEADLIRRVLTNLKNGEKVRDADLFDSLHVTYCNRNFAEEFLKFFKEESSVGEVIAVDGEAI